MSAELITHLTNGENIFEITAADFNGESFDGAPLVPVYPRRDPSVRLTWLDDGLKSGTLFMQNLHETDYVNWGVKAPDGEKLWGGPGDYLVRMPDESILLFNSKAFDQILKPLLAMVTAPIKYSLDEYKFDNGAGWGADIWANDIEVATRLRKREAEDLLAHFRQLDSKLGRTSTVVTPK